MFRGSIATALARLHGSMGRTEIVKPIYKETWWAEQRREQEKGKILFYRGRSILTEMNVGTIGHVDSLCGDSDLWLLDIIKQNYGEGYKSLLAFGSTGGPIPN